MSTKQDQVDGHEMARQATENAVANGSITKRDQTKFMMEMGRRMVYASEGSLIEALLVAMNAIRLTEVDASVKEELADAITGHYYHLRGDAE